jgi:uncharacterized lipoprotein YmbA
VKQSGYSTLKPLGARLAPFGCACVAALLLSACGSSPPHHFYTLGSSGALTTGAANGNASAASATNSGANPGLNPGANQTAAGTTRPPTFYIELPPVTVPQQVARDQMVISTGPGQVDILEQQRWAAPLADELGQALSGDLSAALATFDVYRTPRPDSLPVYRITVNVRNFSSVPGAHASIDAVWSVRRLPGGTPLTCHSAVTENVGPGYDALVGGHRRAVARMAEQIAEAVQTVNAIPQPVPMPARSGASTPGMASLTPPVTSAAACPPQGMMPVQP